MQEDRSKHGGHGYFLLRIILREVLLLVNTYLYLLVCTGNDNHAFLVKRGEVYYCIKHIKQAEPIPQLEE